MKDESLSSAIWLNFLTCSFAALSGDKKLLKRSKRQDAKLKKMLKLR